MGAFGSYLPGSWKDEKRERWNGKYMQIIRYATIGITIVQAIGVSVGLGSLTGRAGESAVMERYDYLLPASLQQAF